MVATKVLHVKPCGGGVEHVLQATIEACSQNSGETLVNFGASLRNRGDGRMVE